MNVMALLRLTRSLCYYFAVVYYLKATFGLGTGDAVLEIPVSITGRGRCLSFAYRISSPRIELAVYKFKTGKTESSHVQTLKYTDQEYIGRWNSEEFAMNSDVEAIQLVAKKTGVTTVSYTHLRAHETRH